MLVTGAGTGIGRGVALEFAKEGGDVVSHYAHSSDGAVSAVDEITHSGGKAAAFQADLSDIGQCQDLVAQAREFLGGIDVLINNAGITMNKPFMDVTPEHYNKLYDVNIRGMFFVTQAGVRDMIEQGQDLMVNGLLIRTGDILVCDGDGITRIEPRLLNDVIRACQEVRKKEAKLHKYFSSPDFDSNAWELWKETN